MAALSGISATEAIGRRATDLLGGLLGGSGDADLRAIEDGDAGVARDRPYHASRRPDSSERGWMELRYGPLRTGDGQRLGTFVYVRDQTERHSADAQRRRTMDDLTHAVTVREQAMSMASHELKSPLTALRLQIERIGRAVDGIRKSGLEGGGLGRIERATGMLVQQVARISRLVDDLLDVSRMGLRQLDLLRTDADLAEIARSTLERFSDALAAAGYEVEVDLPGQIVGHWDPFRLEQVVVNLVTNAMKYGAGRPISLSLRREGRQAHLTVRDRGRGIAADDQARIFQCFERAVGPGEAAGLGLGLYIAKEIVELHGGRIAVDSIPGQGAAFTVELPLDEPSDRAPFAGGA